MAVTGSERNMMPMEKHSKFGKVILYQNIGFLVVIGLAFVDELVRLSSLIFWDQPFTWEFRRTTLAMLLVLAVWFVVGRSTRRVLDASAISNNSCGCARGAVSLITKGSGSLSKSF
jgi:hypothetical protein